MINVSFADPWLHVTARGLWQALSSLCYSSYTSQRMQTQFSGGFSGSEGVIAPLNCVDIKLRVLIFGTQLIVARASRAVENGSYFEDKDEDDDPASWRAV